MTFFRESTQPVSLRWRPHFPIVIDIAAGTGTALLMGVLLSERIICDQLVQIGRSSEEWFRGDRLPVRPLLVSLQKDACEE